jgi:hypothetical protein
MSPFATFLQLKDAGLEKEIEKIGKSSNYPTACGTFS